MHLFFDTVWKLHIGEIPEKRFDVRKFSEGIEKYNQEVAAIKANALTVLNPEIGIVESSCGTKCMIDGYVGWDRVPLHTPIQPDKFYKWTGSYYKAHKEQGWVAILTLPEEKKNTMENSEEWRASPKPKKPLNERLDSLSKKIKSAMKEKTASGSVAAPKEERVCPKCGSGKVIMFTSDDDLCQSCGATFPGVLNSSSELASLRQQLKEREEVLKELLEGLENLNSYAPDFPEYPNSLSQFDLGLSKASKDAKAIIERARNLLSK